MTEDEVTPDTYQIESVGFLLKKPKPGHLSLAQSVTQSGQFDHVIHILTGMVVSVVILNV